MFVSVDDVGGYDELRLTSSFHSFAFGCHEHTFDTSLVIFNVTAFTGDIWTLAAFA